MPEQLQTRQQESLGPGPQGLGDLFGGDSEPVTVSHGPYSEQLPVGGMSVEAIRSRYRDRFDIDPDSIPIVDGDQVGDHTTVQPGQMLTFIRRAGEKGRAAWAPPAGPHARRPRRPGATPKAERHPLARARWV